MAIEGIIQKLLDYTDGVHLAFQDVAFLISKLKASERLSDASFVLLQYPDESTNWDSLAESLAEYNEIRMKLRE